MNAKTKKTHRRRGPEHRYYPRNCAGCGREALGWSLLHTFCFRCEIAGIAQIDDREDRTERDINEPLDGPYD